MAMAATAILQAIVTAYSLYQQSQAAAYQGQVQKVNEQIQRNNALLYQQQAAAQAKQQERKNDLLLAHMRSQYAASGVDVTEGSPLLVMADSARQAGLEEANIRYQGDLRAAGANAAAVNYGNEARLSDWSAGRMRTGAGLSLLSGAVKAGSAYRSGGTTGYDPGNANMLY